MATILHLSDVHLLTGASPPKEKHPTKRERQTKILASMEAAMRRDVGHADLVVISGDVFDSSKAPWDEAEAIFKTFLAHIDAAVGPETPIVVLPGNHDRRDSGVIGPHDHLLFEKLATLGSKRLTVVGSSTSSLVEVLPPVKTLDARLVAFDSTYLPRGYVGAGGWLRMEDLLQMAAVTADDPPEQPLLFLLHHHLVPTPLTDVGAIETAGRPLWQQWLIGSALPRLVANGDREELTMTALGAGTALSLLHSLGRPVVVLHGHKHYPTARVLSGTQTGDGDLVLASAGSAGTSEPYQPTTHPNAMRLWPSFNVVRLDDVALEVSSVSFSPTTPGRASAKRRLLSARRDGKRWTVLPVDEGREFEVLVDHNSAAFELHANTSSPSTALDLRCTRRVDSSKHLEYTETVEGLDGYQVFYGDDEKVLKPKEHLPVPLNQDLRYVARDAVCADANAAIKAYGEGTAHEWVGLLNRYGTRRATLSLDFGTALRAQPSVFGSITDLNTGRERPARIRFDGKRHVIDESSCAPRTLLRIYWSLP